MRFFDVDAIVADIVAILECEHLWVASSSLKLDEGYMEHTCSECRVVRISPVGSPAGMLTNNEEL